VSYPYGQGFSPVETDLTSGEIFKVIATIIDEDATRIAAVSVVVGFKDHSVSIIPCVKLDETLRPRVDALATVHLLADGIKRIAADWPEQ
jgi:hypothetical protein